MIIVFLAVMTWTSTFELYPFKPIDTKTPALKIQVIALDWKWLFLYPEQGIASVNDVAFPEKTPIQFEITSDAPMNAFWIPQLGGQIYAMPAMRTELNLIADEIGSYRGCSANISGTGFAGMTFMAHATSVADFESWVQSARQSAQNLSLDAYQALVLPSSYHPVTFYASMEENLFESVIMKYYTQK